MYFHADRVIGEAIAGRQIPGAVWAAARGGTVLARRAQGFADPEGGVPMTAGTQFDLASLTKVTATLPVVLRLLEQGRLRLDDPIALFLPECPSPDVRIRHLLTHTAGYPAGERLWGPEWSREQALAELARLAPSNPVGERVQYSDLGFMLLGMVAERLAGQRLDALARDLVFGPLGMNGTTYLPGPGAAPTEYRAHLGRRQQSEVHDEKATVLGGVAGHAGLFGTADDLLRYAGMWLGWPGPRLLSPWTRRLAVTEHAVTNGERRGLGWLLHPTDFASCGDLMSPDAFGHTGFTGTSLWIDPEADLAVVLLTNRVYYGRQDHIQRIRPLFHNALMSELA